MPNFSCRIRKYVESHRNLLHLSPVFCCYIDPLLNLHALNIQGNIYNVGDDSLVESKANVAKIIMKFVEGTKIINMDDEGQKETRNYFISHNKIRKIGYRTNVSLEESIRDMVAYLKVKQT